MRRTLAALGAVVLALSACGASHGQPTSPSSVTTTSTAPRSSPARPPRLRVRRAPFRLPVALGREAVIDRGSYAIVAGGLVGGDSSAASAYRVDFRDDRVTRLPALDVAVHDTAGAWAGGEALVLGGGNAVEQGVVQAFDGHRWQVVGHLPQARSDLVAATVGGRVFVLGGYNGSRPAEPHILASADGRRWIAVGRLRVPVRYAACVTLDGAVWLFGGERGGVMQTVVQRVDPATGRTRVVAHLPGPLGHATAMVFGDRILLVGGRTGLDTLTSRMWWFDPATRAFTPAGHLPTPLSDSAVAEWNGRYYLIGGETPALTDRIMRVTYR